MKTHPAPLPPPPVKRLEPILPSMTDATLMNKQKLLGIVYSQLQGIVAHARFGCKYRYFYRKTFRFYAKVQNISLELFKNLGILVNTIFIDIFSAITPRMSIGFELAVTSSYLSSENGMIVY